MVLGGLEDQVGQVDPEGGKERPFLSSGRCKHRGSCRELPRVWRRGEEGLLKPTGSSHGEASLLLKRSASVSSLHLHDGRASIFAGLWEATRAREGK